MPPLVATRMMALPVNLHSLPENSMSMDPTHYSNPAGSDNMGRRSVPSTQPQYYGTSTAPPAYHQSGTHGYPISRDFADMDVSNRSIGQPTPLDYRPYYSSVQSASSTGYRRYSNASGHLPPTPIGHPPRPVSVHTEWNASTPLSPDSYMQEPDSPRSFDAADYLVEMNKSRHGDKSKTGAKYHSQRRPSNRDEFDGPHQLLEPPSPTTISAQERELPGLPTNLDISEQDRILCEVNDRLSQCAFDFIAKYQFPIPIEPDKRQVRVPADREWTEWVYLLKRLATKRRIPARVLYNGQIKQLVTILENSLEMRHVAKHQSRPVKDDRNVLQLISAGTQVAKILKDATAMEYLDRLYQETEGRIHDRQTRRVKFAS